MKEHIIQINTDKCIGCGLCQRDCPVNNISIINKKAVIKSQNCIKCGHCVAICPKMAVSMTNFDEPPIEIDKPEVLNPKQLLETIRTRRSIRQFTNKPIENEIIKQIIEAGRFTPTGGNVQDVNYIVLKDNIQYYEKIAVRLFKRLFPMIKLINPMAKDISINEHFFFKKAPAAIMIISKDKINGALAASNMELMAEAFGIGVLYNGFFTIAANRSLSLRKALGLKYNDKVITTLVLGYSSVTYPRTAQKETPIIRFL